METAGDILRPFRLSGRSLFLPSLWTFRRVMYIILIADNPLSFYRPRPLAAACKPKERRF